MTSVDMGFEAALNLGLTPAAAGKSAVLDAPVIGKAMSRVSHSKDAGTACFKTALQAAAERDPTGGVGSAASTAGSAAVMPNDGETPPETDSIGCADAEGDPNSAETPTETELADKSELVCGQWVEPAPAASATEDPVGGAVEGDSDAADTSAAEAAASPETIELLDRQRRLQASMAGDSTATAVGIRRIGERIESYPAAPDANTGTVAGNIPAPALKQLGDALSAAAPESAVASEADSTAERPAAVSGTEDPATIGQEAPGVRSAADAADGLPAVQRLWARFHQAREALNSPPATTAVDGEAPAVSAEGDASLSPSPAATGATASDASALRTTVPPEAARNGGAPESFRLAGVEAEGRAAAAETCQEPSAESGDFRQASDDARYSKMQAAASLATGEGEAPADVLSFADRATQASPVAEKMLEKTTESAPASRDKEALAGTGRAAIFDQIVQRAAVQLRNDQGEINIDLKPDFLGRVRMQILTENQQVSVRIVAERAAVRDMIETGLNQLKSELQAQGLQVERLEVAVADDHRQRGWHPAHTAPAWRTAAAGADTTTERSEIEERATALYYRPRPGGTASIDMFV